MFDTFHHSLFSDAVSLVNAKQLCGHSVSVVIPALNEESTIGTIISKIKRYCVDEWALVDEIVVIDGHSSDETARVAEKNGAKVFALDDIGPSVQCQGKGVALWKSQFVTKGEIIIFIDSDLIDFDQRFIYGLLGVMLNYPEKVLVKSFYNRPLVIDSCRLEQQGGRVTELLVKPLIEFFVPELKDICQPLSGEYALRRDVFRAFPFWSGYSVEIGLLLDTWFNCGGDCIAQVDMDHRTHRNRSIEQLHFMAASILRVFMHKMHSRGILTLSNECIEMSMLGNCILSNDGCDIELEPYGKLMRC
ncbi:MAG: glucosyl-3-phosphoglycerate synthase [Chitinispirillaceae bacterium]|nr:glucosyl-3-phosphoglycerate synthase [Chitinispirillaceae bacterium]